MDGPAAGRGPQPPVVRVPFSLLLVLFVLFIAIIMLICLVFVFFLVVCLSLRRYWGSSGALLLRYIEEPSIINIWPLIGPYAGYVNLTLTGANFLTSGGPMYCAFSNPTWTAPTVTTPARVLNSTALLCLTPPVAPILGNSAPGSLRSLVSLMYNGVQIAPTLTTCTCPVAVVPRVWCWLVLVCRCVVPLTIVSWMSLDVCVRCVPASQTSTRPCPTARAPTR